LDFFLVTVHLKPDFGIAIAPKKRLEESKMARYGRKSQSTVESAMKRRKQGKLRSGKDGKGGKVTSRKQAIAIGLSEARKKGAKVPRRKKAS
jgi:hypothetical protein